MTDWVSALQEDWDQNKPAQKDMTRIPDGKHRAVIGAAVWDEETKSLKWRIVFPDVGDRSLGKTTFLFAKDGVTPQTKWAFQELEVLGEKDVKIENIAAHMANCVGKAVNITLDTPEGKKYSNIYFNSPAESRPEDATANW